MNNCYGMRREDGKSNLKFVAQVVIPKGYTLVNAGLVWSTKDMTELTLESELKPTYISKISTTGQFSVTINGVPSGMKVRGRAFVQVRDKQGRMYTVYSEETMLYAK